MSKITAEHLQGNACVYIRQSTQAQPVHNLERPRRQYGLAERAKQLGGTTVEIVDDDLGNKAVIYDILFKASAETMITIAADPKPLGARIGVLSVLHTWRSALTHHPHVHMIVPGGGISL